MKTVCKIQNIFPKKLIRKREVLISRVTVYIVILIVTCHSIRLVPTIWEIVETISQAGAISEEFSWPAWVDIVTVVSHLTLTISSSLSFYIYFLLYGAKHKVNYVLSFTRFT